MSFQVEDKRPNIQIEFHNNLVTEDVERMETDELPDANHPSSDEEGEIVETTQRIKSKGIFDKTKVNQESNTFEAGINVFDKKQLDKRARRFQLNPEELNNFTDLELEQLRDSLGLNAINDKEYRLEAVHMFGTDEMSSKDIMKYFIQYAPSSIEWINDDSCNVVWSDPITSARALFYLSRSIEGMPVEGPCDPFAKQDSDKKDLRDVSHDEIVDVATLVALGPVPPGYWRLGKPHTKSKLILLRFASKSDKKPQGAEKFSQYYKKYGNPNYGGLKGFISQSKRFKLRGIHEEEALEPKNPWGSLAKSWSHDIREPVEVPAIVVQPQSNNLQHRLGFKHNREESDEAKEAPKSKVPRMRMYADEEEAKVKQRKLKAMQTKQESRDLRQLIRGKPASEYEEEEFVQEPSALPQLPHEISSFKEDGRAILNAKSRSKFGGRIWIENNSFKVNVANDNNRRRQVETKPSEQSSSSDEEMVENGKKTGSKVAVVIKKQKQPTVASTVWSRINAKPRKESSSENSSSEWASEGDDDDRRLGFRSEFKSNVSDTAQEYKSPLRIEINNDHYKNKKD